MLVTQYGFGAEGPFYAVWLSLSKSQEGLLGRVVGEVVRGCSATADSHILPLLICPHLHGSLLSGCSLGADPLPSRQCRVSWQPQVFVTVTAQVSSRTVTFYGPTFEMVFFVNFLINLLVTYINIGCTDKSLGKGIWKAGREAKINNSKTQTLCSFLVNTLWESCKGYKKV